MRERTAAVFVIVFLLAATGFEILTGREHWPFSPYPMFSEAAVPDTVFRVDAWAEAEGIEPVSLITDRVPSPWDPIRLRVSLQRFARDTDRVRLRSATEALLRRLPPDVRTVRVTMHRYAVQDRTLVNPRVEPLLEVSRDAD